MRGQARVAERCKEAAEGAGMLAAEERMAGDSGRDQKGESQQVDHDLT